MNFTFRKLQEQDRGFIVQILGDVRMTQFLPFTPMNEMDAGARFDGYMKLNHQSLDHQGFFGVYANQASIGYGFIRNYVWEPEWANRLEVGILILPEYWGQGIATALSTYLKQELKVNEPLIALVHAENKASQRLCEKFGFKFLQSSKKYPDYYILELVLNE